jgi:hypothetical protein
LEHIVPGIIFPRPPKKIHQRQLQVRAQLWPTVTPTDLWNRHTHDGFSTIPSTITLIMSIMDDLASQPVSSTYLDLWTRAYDESFVTLSKPREMAFHAGFVSQRAERTWKLKLKALHKLNFIDLKSGPSGPESYALIWNPYHVIKWHREKKTPGLREDKYNALVVRALEVGDKTFAPPAPAAADVPPPIAPATAAATSSPRPSRLTTPIALALGDTASASPLRKKVRPSPQSLKLRSTKRA